MTDRYGAQTECNCITCEARRIMVTPYINKIDEQAAEIERLKGCIQDARRLMADYDCCFSDEQTESLLAEMDALLKTRKPMKG